MAVAVRAVKRRAREAKEARTLSNASSPRSPCQSVEKRGMGMLSRQDSSCSSLSHSSTHRMSLLQMQQKLMTNEVPEFIEMWETKHVVAYISAMDPGNNMIETKLWEEYAALFGQQALSGEDLLMMRTGDLVHMGVEWHYAGKIMGKLSRLYRWGQKKRRMDNNSYNERVRSKSALSDVDIDDFDFPECCLYLLFLICFTLLVISMRGEGDSNFWISENMARPTTGRGFSQSSTTHVVSKRWALPSYSTPTKSYRSSGNFGNNDMGSTQRMFGEIREEKEMWMHLRQVLLPILFANADYWVGMQNKLLGGIRVRTVRVEPTAIDQEEGSGITANRFKGIGYTPEHKSDLPISIPALKISSIPWTSAEQNEEPAWWSGVVYDYPGSGYVLDIPLNRTKAYMTLKSLEDNNFIDRSTRGVFVDWNMYNPNVGRHCVARLAYEITEYGFINPYKQIKTWNFRFATTGWKWILFLFFVLYFTYQECYEVIEDVGYPGSYVDDNPILPVAIFTLKEGRPVRVNGVSGRIAKDVLPKKMYADEEKKDRPEDKEILWIIDGETEMQTLSIHDLKKNIRRKKRDPDVPALMVTGTSVYEHYFNQSTFFLFWDMIDIANLVMFYMFIVQTYMLENYKRDFDLLDEHHFRSYRLLNEYVVRSSYLTMMNGSLLYLKIFKYCTFSKRVLMLIAMLLSAAGPIAYFIFCACIITGCFAYQGYVLFSIDVFEFRTMQNAFINGLKYWATSMDIRQIRESNRTMGLFFFIMWTIIFLLVLASVFVAILMDAYDVENEAIKADIRAGKKEKSFKELIMQALQDWRDRAEAARAKALKIQRRASDISDFVGAHSPLGSPLGSPRQSDSSSSDSGDGDDDDDQKFDSNPVELTRSVSYGLTSDAEQPAKGFIVRASNTPSQTKDKNPRQVKVALPSRIPKRRGSPSPPTPVPSTPMLSEWKGTKFPSVPGAYSPRRTTPSESAFRIPDGPPSPGGNLTKFSLVRGDSPDLQEA